jgi:hypothetical protein
MSEPQQPKEGEDYYINDDGWLVMTATYHLKRGYCCGSACKHCPYDHVNVPEHRKPDNQKRNNN